MATSHKHHLEHDRGLPGKRCLRCGKRGLGVNDPRPCVPHDSAHDDADCTGEQSHSVPSRRSGEVVGTAVKSAY